MKSVFCFGELLLRFSPQLMGEWHKQGSMPVFIGGAELNVATALNKWEVPVKYGTALPDNYLSAEIVDALDAKQIDTSAIKYSGSRIGLYYLPQGADMKNAGVIYDRAHSSFASLQPGQLNWELILKDVNWFHFSAINPALSHSMALVCKEAVEAARRKNIFISCDLNYRAKLWQYGKHPLDVMPELISYCNLIMGNVWAAETMLGIPVTIKNKSDQQECLQQAITTSGTICNQYQQCEQVANTYRFSKEKGIRYYACLYIANQLYVSEERETDEVIDQVGSGDCFMAGLIYGNVKKYTPQEVIDFATAAAFNKLFIKGDVTTSSVAEIKNQVFQ